MRFSSHTKNERTWFLVFTLPGLIVLGAHKFQGGPSGFNELIPYLTHHATSLVATYVIVFVFLLPVWLILSSLVVVIIEKIVARKGQ